MPCVARRVPAGGELTVGGPLHEFLEFAVLGMRLPERQQLVALRARATAPAIPATAFPG